MILALLLAFSISSPRIGTFFDLPGWMPTEVPSDRTFGSDDATNMTHRVDDVALSAVNAVFEGYYERVYYANAGLSNVWNEAEYGPQCQYGSGLDRFRFGPSNSVGRSRFVYDPDTNRAVRTRRLVEYDNLRGLSTVLADRSSVIDVHLRIRRPSWNRTVKSGSYYSHGAYPIWSTSLLDGLTLEHGQPESDFPVIPWKQKSSFLSTKDRYFWNNLTLSFEDVRYSNLDPVNWGEFSTGSPNRIAQMLDAISFGDHPNQEEMYDDNYLYWGTTVTNTTMDIVGRGHAVTNVTQEVRHDESAKLNFDTYLGGGVDYHSLRQFVIVKGEQIGAIYHFYDTNVLAHVEFPDSPQFDARPGYYDPGYAEITGRLTIRIYVEGVEVPIYTDAPTFTEYSSVTMSRMTEGFNETPIETDLFRSGFDVRYHYATSGGIADVEYYCDTESPLCTLAFDYYADVTNVSYRAGLDGITNDTRRLVTDRLAGLGIGLSALDRTYCHVAHVIPTTVTNWIGTASRDYESVPFSPSFTSFSWSDGAWTATITEETDIPAPVQSGQSSGVSGQPSSRYDDYVCYANPARLTFSVGTVVDPSSEPGGIVTWTEEDVIRIFGEAAKHVSQASGQNRVGCDLGTVRFLANDGSIEIGASVYYPGASYVSVTYNFGKPSMPTNVVLFCGATASTAYEFGETWSEDGLLCRSEGYMPYPGDYSRIDRSRPPKLWTVLARGCKAGVSDTREWYTKSGQAMNPISYSSSWYGDQSFDYSSAVGEYSSLAGAWATADGHYAALKSGCVDRFRSVSGIGSPADVIGMLDRVSRGIAANGTLQNLVLGANAALNVDLVPICGPGDPTNPYEIIFDVDGDSVTVEGVYTWGGYRTEFPIAVYGIGVSLRDDTRIKTGHDPHGYDFHGCGVAGRMTSLSKVDWDWKALKRERNNQ